MYQIKILKIKLHYKFNKIAKNKHKIKDYPQLILSKKIIIKAIIIKLIPKKIKCKKILIKIF